MIDSIFKTIVYWEDPEDHDRASSYSFEIFKNNQDALDYLNREIKHRPKLQAYFFERCRQRVIAPEQLVTKFRLID